MNSKSKIVPTVCAEKITFCNVQESIRLMLTAAMHVAARDAVDIMESSSLSREGYRRDLTRRDGASFWIDGRADWFREILDQPYDYMPDAWEHMIPALDLPERVCGVTFGDLLNERHEKAMAYEKANGFDK